MIHSNQAAFDGELEYYQYPGTLAARSKISEFAFALFYAKSSAISHT
jgi:hypothetical protein